MILWYKIVFPRYRTLGLKLESYNDQLTATLLLAAPRCNLTTLSSRFRTEILIVELCQRSCLQMIMGRLQVWALYIGTALK